MSRRVGRRALAVASLAAAVAAGTAAVLSALGAGAASISQAKAAAPAAGPATQSVSFGNSGVVVKRRGAGLTCFQVRHGRSTVARSCTSPLADDEIAYASSRYAVGGLAGSSVRAVIVRLTDKGTVWATLRRGAFYADVPSGHNVRTVVKVLSDGTRTSFTVTGSR
jgi:hypothetical protein